MVRDNIALTTMINDHDGGDYDAEEDDVEEDDVEDDDGTDDLVWEDYGHWCQQLVRKAGGHSENSIVRYFFNPRIYFLDYQ